MGQETPGVRLALSLHAPDDALRSELMPVNERYPLRDVLDACLRWHERRRRPVFIEYLMLDGVNDRYEQAQALGELLQPREAFKVNLSPTTRPTPSSAAPPARRSRPSGLCSRRAGSGSPCGLRAGATSTRRAASWPRPPISPHERAWAVR
jgi:wyosine [tRNA(Phe)-imidazoG37] synthetase (radical SAM superfamily)